MNYYMKYKVAEPKPQLITKVDVYRHLCGWWNEDFVKDMLDNDNTFRVDTPYAEFWTEKDGMIPMAGFYGTCD